MSLRIRRGLDADRLTIVFEEGEIIYATDTKLAYIGDDLTLGGNPLGAVTTDVVETIQEGDNVSVDNADPANPIISVANSLFDDKADASDLSDHTGDATIHFTEASIDKYTQTEVDNLLDGKEDNIPVPTNEGLNLASTEAGVKYWDLPVKAHSELTDYDLDDVVTMNGDLYTCIAQHTAQAFDATNWRTSTSPVGFGMQLTYRWSDTVAGDPLTGEFSINDATPAAATHIYVNQTTAEGNDVAFIWATIHKGDIIGFEESVADNESVYYKATGPSSYNTGIIEIPVQYEGGSGVPDNGTTGIASYVADPANKLPVGGTTNQSLVKSSNNNYETEWDTRLANVVEDTTPFLGGTLGTLGNYIAIEQSDGTVVAGIKDNVDGTGATFFRTLDGLYDEHDGVVLVGSGLTQLGGTTAIVNALANETGDKQVYCDQNGTLYGIDPPVAGWEVSAADSGVYTLIDNSQWLDITGLSANPNADVADGDPIHINAIVHVVNDSRKRGTIALGVGVDNIDPIDNGVSYNIAAGFNSIIIFQITTTIHGGLTTTQPISLFAKYVDDNGSAFDPVLDGSVNAHEMVISVAGEGGSGVASHPDLTERNSADQHTTFAITGLDDELASKPTLFHQDAEPVVYEIGDLHMPTNQTTNVNMAFSSTHKALNFSTNEYATIELPHTFPANACEIEIVYKVADGFTGTSTLVASSGATALSGIFFYPGSQLRIIIDNNINSAKFVDIPYGDIPGFNDGNYHKFLLKFIGGTLEFYFDDSLVNSPYAFSLPDGHVPWTNVGSRSDLTDFFTGSIYSVGLLDLENSSESVYWTLDSGNTDEEIPDNGNEVNVLNYFNVEAGDWVDLPAVGFLNLLDSVNHYFNNSTVSLETSNVQYAIAELSGHSDVTIAKLDDKPNSIQENTVGSVVANMIQMTQAEYDVSEKNADTFYIIVG